MAVSVDAVELRVGRPAGGRAATAVSTNLSAMARWLGWLLAVVARAVAGRTDLDSAWSVFAVSAIARAVAGPSACPTPGCGGGDRHERGPQADEWWLGLRPISGQFDVPHTTLRSWWQRFRVRSSTLLAQCTALAVALDGTAVDVTLGAARERAALDGLRVAWQRAVTRFGERIGSPWSFWSRISGGQALGTHTTSPWAPGAEADWMAPSPLGGPAP